MMNEFMGDTAERRTVQVPILDKTLTTEVAGDYSLPDYQPEIKRLLRIGANVLPPNRFAGSSGTELGGTVDYYVLYMGHDGGIYCAPLSAEYRMEAQPDSAVAGNLSAVGEPMVCLCDAIAETPVGRVTAPRHLNIRCRIQAAVKLYGECALEEIGEDGDPTLERLMGQAEVGRLYWGMGDPLPLRDDVILPPAGGEMRVICAEGQVMITEATPALGLVNCRGEVTVKLILCPAESEEAFASDSVEQQETPALTVMQRKIPFSQAIEVEGVTPACTATACGYCSDMSVQMEEGHIHLDLGVVTEVRAQKNETVPYVGDLYSTRREGECLQTVYPAELGHRTLNGNFTLSDSQPLSQLGIDPATKVADVTATAIPAELITDPGKGRCVLTGKCHCHLLFLRDGEYSSADMELPFRYEFDDQTLTRAGNAGAIQDSDSIPGFDGRVTVINCRARMDGERVGVDAELAVALRIHRPAPFMALSDMRFGDEVTRRRGEYVICFPTPTDSVWSVAKRYHAPMAALTAANNLPTGASANSRESLDGIGYLIV